MYLVFVSRQILDFQRVFIYCECSCWSMTLLLIARIVIINCVLVIIFPHTFITITSQNSSCIWFYKFLYMKYRLVLLGEALVYIYAHSKRNVLDLYKWKCFPVGSRPDVQFNIAMDCGFNGQLIISMKSMKKDIQNNGQRNRTKGQTIMYKTLHSKQKTEQHDQPGFEPAQMSRKGKQFLYQ